MSSHIYVAAPYGARDDAEKLANLLWEYGFVITSRWHSGPIAAAQRTREVNRRIAAQNWHDVNGADILVGLARSEGRGTLVEIGAAIALEIPIILVGNPDDVTLMVDHDSVLWVKSFEEVILALTDNDDDDSN